jgi:hypothetical protein
MYACACASALKYSWPCLCAAISGLSRPRSGCLQQVSTRSRSLADTRMTAGRGRKDAWGDAAGRSTWPGSVADRCACDCFVCVCVSSDPPLGRPLAGSVGTEVNHAKRPTAPKEQGSNSQEHSRQIWLLYTRCMNISFTAQRIALHRRSQGDDAAKRSSGKRFDAAGLGACARPPPRRWSIQTQSARPKSS